ncbi:MAG: hypothetical protein V4492_03225 [Chlamydiota bacterium]
MSVEFEFKSIPSWERISRTEFIRTKYGPDGTEQKTRWSFSFDQASLLGLGGESCIFLLRTQDALCPPKAIKVNHSCVPHLLHETQTLNKIQGLLGRRSAGIHLSINAHFERGKLSIPTDRWAPRSIIEECLIMRKYEKTLGAALPCLSKNEKLEAMRQISKGLADLHALGIAHRDVHLNNMMYDARRNEWCLIDVTTFNSKESMRDDIDFLILCIEKEVLNDESHLIDKLKKLSNPQAFDIYQILMNYST